MQVLIIMLLIVYLAGVVVVLIPTLRSNWAATDQFFSSIANELPRALAWPVAFYRDTVERGLSVTSQHYA